MKKFFVGFLVVVLLLVAVATVTAQTGETTINLRTCIDTNGDKACQSGDIWVDGVLVCLKAGRESWQCGTTEDGEHWFDSRNPGRYWARAEIPSGYTLQEATCTTFFANPYEPCRVRGNLVRFDITSDVVAVNINFLLQPK